LLEYSWSIFLFFRHESLHVSLLFEYVSNVNDSEDQVNRGQHDVYDFGPRLEISGQEISRVA
jgi:hypothetical protein